VEQPPAGTRGVRDGYTIREFEHVD
jgi:hypothetical protein